MHKLSNPQSCDEVTTSQQQTSQNKETGQSPVLQEESVSGATGHKSVDNSISKPLTGKHYGNEPYLNHDRPFPEFPVNLCNFCRKYGSVRQQPIYSSSFSTLPLVTHCEMKKHVAGCETIWIRAGRDVYDVTSYIMEHPGGVTCLLRRSDGTADAEEDYQFHSRSGKNQWAALKIAHLIPCDQDQFQGENCIIL